MAAGFRSVHPVAAFRLGSVAAASVPGVDLGPLVLRTGSVAQAAVPGRTMLGPVLLTFGAGEAEGGGGGGGMSRGQQRISDEQDVLDLLEVFFSTCAN